ncbi:extracellular solute-binding protein [Deinococcus aquiradiocola]|uniref:Lipoprotein LipO n=1 Tax=Deinococcus aquiradiocola TaxID=393059 RepID=A0A917P854_9DEIO|nr:extracellular solute-binding protein [Deinococcus aquiradiocola]GGJ66346.1 lipoprotein LipO [Deinococcus aquiradiocola]
MTRTLHALTVLVSLGSAVLGQAAAQSADLNVTLYAANPEAPAPGSGWETADLIRAASGANLKFTMIPTGADGDNKIGALAAANSLPDLFEIRNRTLFYQLIRQGQIAPVGPLLTLMPQRTRARYSSTTRNGLVNENGQMYGLQEPAALSRQYGIMVRQDWLDRLNLRAPTTLEDFLNVARAFTERDPDGNGRKDTYGYCGVIDFDNSGIFPSLGLGNHFQWIYGAYGVPGTWNYRNGTAFAANLRSPAYRQATEYVRKLVDARVMDPDWATMKRSDLRNRWQQGRCGMFFESVGGFNAGFKNFDANNPRGDATFIAAPTGPGNHRSMGTYANAGTLLVVSRKAMDAGKGQAIAKLLEWANSGPGYMQLVFGTKGLDYTLVKGVPTVTNRNATERLTDTQLKYLSLNGSTQELKARYATARYSDGRSVSLSDLLAFTQRRNNWIDRSGDLVVPAAPNQADIDRYVSESLVQFVLGQRPLNDSSWKSFQDGLNGLNFTAYEKNAAAALRANGYLK